MQTRSSQRKGSDWHFDIIFGTSEQSPHDKKAIQPIGLVHGMQTACNALRQKVSDKSRSVIKDISLCDCEAASASTESMLQQHTELNASASSKTIKFHRNKTKRKQKGSAF